LNFIEYVEFYRNQKFLLQNRLSLKYDFQNRLGLKIDFENRFLNIIDFLSLVEKSIDLEHYIFRWEKSIIDVEISLKKSTTCWEYPVWIGQKNHFFIDLNTGSPALISFILMLKKLISKYLCCIFTAARCRVIILTHKAIAVVHGETCWPIGLIVDPWAN